MSGLFRIVPGIRDGTWDIHGGWFGWWTTDHIGLARLLYAAERSVGHAPLSFSWTNGGHLWWGHQLTDDNMESLRTVLREKLAELSEEVVP